MAIVDDEESIRRSLLRLFRLTDFDATAYESAQEFLDALPSKRPDCIVLDLKMPGMSGIDLLKRLACVQDAPPVIVVTADSADRARDECLRLGSKYWLQKPVDSKTLIDRVRDLVECS
ncbi:MAG: response regulator transcription factor [Gammaproteobacteria bacterium]